MTLVLIIIASWILILSVIVGLCLSAHQGDLQQLNDTPAHPASDPIAAASISPRITAQPSRRAYPCKPTGFPSGATRYAAGVTSSAKG